MCKYRQNISKLMIDRPKAVLGAAHNFQRSLMPPHNFQVLGKNYNFLRALVLSAVRLSCLICL